MTTETCRNAAEELQHDRNSTARQRKIAELQRQKFAEYKAECDTAEMISAITECSDETAHKRLERAFQSDNYAQIGIIVAAMTSEWLSLQAVKAVDKMIDRGDV